MQRSMLAFAVAAAMVITTGTSHGFQRGNGGGSKTGAAGAVSKGGKAQAPTATKSQGGHKAQTGGKAQGGSKVQGGTKTQGGAKAQGGNKAQGSNKAQSGNKAQGAKTTSGSGKKDTPTSTSSSKETITAGATSSEAGTATLSPVQQKLQSNSKLAAKVSGRLPAGTDLMAASAGFRNLGQFVAAVNVSHNLGIPFSQLKTRMVDDGMSLGRSIQDLRPSADHLREMRRAESEAETIIRSTEMSSSTTSTQQTKPASKGKPRSGSGPGE